ncbi:MAG: hypothetical protein ABMA64_11755 [Myxococcota bacterium]
MTNIPRPTECANLAELAALLDAADHPARVEWIRSLGRSQQYALYALAQGNPVRTDELVRGQGEVVRHIGKNGLLAFTHFQKRFARMGDQVVGYNQDEFPSLLRGVAVAVTGPGHFTAYDSPEVPGEVWIDYRSLGRAIPEEFPPLVDNEHGLRALVFGDLVDVLRRVSRHVFIGDSFKGKPRPEPPPWLCRLGRWLPTAPFVLTQEP